MKDRIPYRRRDSHADKPECDLVGQVAACVAEHFPTAFDDATDRQYSSFLLELEERFKRTLRAIR